MTRVVDGPKDSKNLFTKRSGREIFLILKGVVPETESFKTHKGPDEKLLNSIFKFEP